MPWLIVGIAGCTCSGKSTLARAIAGHLERLRAGGDGDNRPPSRLTHLRRPLGQICIVRQDDYFHKRDSAEHTWIPGWNYINRELLSALDMPRMCADVRQLIAAADSTPASAASAADADAKLNVLLIEGFLIYNHAEVRARCELRFEVRIPREECRRRRAAGRQYNPPNPPAYFDEILWPHYERNALEYAGDGGLVVLDGLLPEAQLLDVALHRMDGYLRRRDNDDDDDESN